MSMNPLAAGGPPPEAPPPMAGPTGPMGGNGPDGSSHPVIDSLEAAHQQAKAQYGKLSKAQSQSTLVRSQMDELLKLGDTVTADDVVEGLGKMVAGGLSPEPLIAMMAGDPKSGEPPMPEGGTGLASWLQAHEQKFAQFEQQIGQAHQVAQHQLGQAATKVLLAHHVADHVRGQMARPTAPPAAAPPAAAPSNPLAG